MKRKTILIVGASSGIGLETAKQLVADGHTVYNASRTKCNHKKVINIVMDVSDAASLRRGMNRILDDSAQKLDALIYCAGCSMAGPLEITSEADFRYLFDVNFFGFAKIAQHVIPVMRKQNGGHIVAVSSLGGLYPIPFDPFYSASKAALTMLVKELQIELAPFNISLTSVMPGGVATEFTFKRKLYPTDLITDYTQNLENAIHSLAENEQGGMTPEKVAESIVAILNSEKPPVTETVGAVNKMYALAEKVLPESVTASLNKMKYDQQ